jgi:hypothetical protein
MPTPFTTVLHKRRRRQTPDDGLSSDEGLDLGNIVPDLPPDPSGAASELFPPLPKQCAL